MRRYADPRSAYPPFPKQLLSITEQYASFITHFIARNFRDERRLVLEIKSRPAASPFILSNWAWKRFFTISNLLLLAWILVLYWGEVSVFDQSLHSCSWEAFEKWPQAAIPHRLVLVADPQLVDPHTYPGRPWPLSTITIKHTDLYLRRSYSRIQVDLDPNTIIFLGDLFDGGREWATIRTRSPEKRFQKYGNLVWQREFNRFGRIFFREWRNQKHPQKARETRRIIATLPGNHDLGFGTGIQKPVRDRYHGYFGEGNQIDLLGNHTFVSLDTVSLSAKEQGVADASYFIWEPTDTFLQNFAYKKDLAITRHLGILHGRQMYERSKHGARNISDRTADILQNHPPSYGGTYFPNVLLSHVPLYRPPNTACGPLRERYPPTPPPPGQDSPLEEDPPNSIPYSHGYQYQNCLTPALSTYILSKMNNDVEFAFSGDDHDYCEVLHKTYPRKGSGLREITVKSISWAMGVKKPGFLMVSLWNPVTETGQRISRYNTPTLKTQLCLLPNQLAVFVRYGIVIGFTTLILLVRAAVILKHPEQFSQPLNMDNSILPVFRGQPSLINDNHQYEFDSVQQYTRPRTSTADSTSMFSPGDSAFLSARNANSTRPRYMSPEPYYGRNNIVADVPYRQTAPVVALPLGGFAQADRFDKKYEDAISSSSSKWKRKRVRKANRFEKFLREWGRSVLRLALKVTVWYLWLLKY